VVGCGKEENEAVRENAKMKISIVITTKIGGFHLNDAYHVISYLSGY
jgi:hypothetical protein